jgi:hypothetical protein
VSRLLFFMAAAAVPGFCQVQVELRTNQATYLAGEPIFVVVDIKNIGSERVGYSASNGHADLTVPGGRKKEAPNLFGCFTGFGEGYGGGVFDPPLMKPGQTVSTWYLLKGYSLRAGDYILHASGKAGVQSYETDPVAGQMFEGSMKLTVEDATEAQLRQRYAPYVADAEGWDMERRARAREAIAEMAPPFLEKTIFSFADQPETARLAVEGLAQIPTEERCSCIGGRCIGNTKDSAAIQVLIQMYADRSGPVQSDVCSALTTLTHYQWCNHNGTQEETQARWRDWWRNHAARLPLYGADQCPAFGAPLPSVN